MISFVIACTLYVIRDKYKHFSLKAHFLFLPLIQHEIALCRDCSPPRQAIMDSIHRTVDGDNSPLSLEALEKRGLAVLISFKNDDLIRRSNVSFLSLLGEHSSSSLSSLADVAVAEDHLVSHAVLDRGSKRSGNWVSAPSLPYGSISFVFNQPMHLLHAWYLIHSSMMHQQNLRWHSSTISYLRTRRSPRSQHYPRRGQVLADG